MSNSKSDKTFVTKWVIGCAVVILIFHLVWAKYLFINLKDPVFTLVDLALIGFFIGQSVGAIEHADDPNKDWKRYAFIVSTAAICFWVGIWATGLMENTGF